MLSFRRASSGSSPRVDATETPKEKAAFHMTTKADPTKAINEAQPGKFLEEICPSTHPLTNLYSHSQCA